MTLCDTYPESDRADEKHTWWPTLDYMSMTYTTWPTLCQVHHLCIRLVFVESYLPMLQRLSPVRLSFTIGTCTPSFWETLLGNLPRLRALEVELIDLRLEDLGQVTLIQWTENMLRFLRPARIACLKIQTNTITCSVNKTSLQIAMDPERLHSLPRLVAESIPSMELFAVGSNYLQPNPYLTHWTRIHVNEDNQRVVEAIDPTAGEESLSRISSRFYESISSTG